MYIAPDGTAAPTLTITDTVDTSPGGTYVDIGYSEDGWSWVYDATYSSWTPAELVDPLVFVKDGQEAHFRGVAAQFSLENIKTAVGGGTIVSAGGISTYTPPETTGFDYFTALFRTTAPSGLARDIWIPRAISVSSADVPHTKGANPSLLGIDLQAVKVTGSPIFEIKEVD